MDTRVSDQLKSLFFGLAVSLCITGTAEALPTPKSKAQKPSIDAEAPTKDDVVARVGSTDVSASDIQSYMATLGVNEQTALAKDPALLNQMVRSLLANRLVLQRALEKKWEDQPAVAAQLNRARESAIVELYLQAVSVPPAGYPNDDDLQKVYEANRASFLVPRQFKVAQIFVPIDKAGGHDADQRAKQKIDEVSSKLRASGANFAAIAQQSSGGGDGDLGWLQEAQIRPEIRTTLMGLAKDEVANPIRLEDGWHILKLLDTRAAYTATLPEIRDQLVQQMRKERANATRRAFIADLLKQHPPVLNELALSGLLSKQSGR